MGVGGGKYCEQEKEILKDCPDLFSSHSFPNLLTNQKTGGRQGKISESTFVSNQ